MTKAIVQRKKKRDTSANSSNSNQSNQIQRRVATPVKLRDAFNNVAAIEPVQNSSNAFNSLSALVTQIEEKETSEAQKEDVGLDEINNEIEQLRKRRTDYIEMKKYNSEKPTTRKDENPLELGEKQHS